MEWETVEVVYWIRSKNSPNFRNQKYKRVIKITDKTTITKLKQLLSVKNIDPVSIGAGKQIIITIGDGIRWQGDFTLSSNLRLCLQEDNYYSYSLDLEDYKFYDKLLELCFINEKKVDPNISKNNILLRQNKGY